MNVPWSEIVEHRERLLRLAARRCPSAQDAEDAVHEAMLRAATFEGLDRARLGPFLTSVTVRLCADVYRGAERGARAARRLDVADVPGPEDAVVAADQAAEIHALLDRLPARQRNVLVDRADGLSVTQISSRHSLTYKATESALSRARATMRLALASAMSLVAAAFATVRRRPAAVVAVPLIAVAVVTTAHRLPSPPAAPPAGAQPGAAPETVLVEARSKQPANAARLARRTPRPPARATVAAPPRRTQHPRPYREVFRYDPPDDRLPSLVVEDDGETVPEMLERCLTADHYSVSVNPRPTGQQAVVDPYCHPKKS